MPRGVFLAVVLLSAVFATSMTSYWAIAEAPTEFFGGKEAAVALDPQAKNPLKGRMSAFVVQDLEAIPGIEAASAELLSPGVVRGQPVMVRGAVPEAFLAVEEARIVSGNAPGEGEAMVGRRAAAHLDVAVGDPLVLTGSYRARVTQVTVSGVFAGGTSEDDVVVRPGLARSLTGMQPDVFHFVRAKTDDPRAFKRAVTSLGAYLTPLSLDVEPDRPAPGDPVTVVVRVKNWGRAGGVEDLTLKVDGRPVAVERVRVQGHTYAEARFAVTLADAGTHRFEVNPEGSVTVSDPAVEIEAPDVVAIGENFTVRARDAPPNATLHIANATRSLANGSAEVSLDTFGRHLARVRQANRTLGARYVAAVEGPLMDVAKGVVVDHRFRPSEPRPGNRLHFTARVENRGGQPLEGDFDLQVDGHRTATVPLSIPPGGHQFASASFPAGLEGGHRVTFLGRETPYEVSTDGGGGGGTGGGEGPPSEWYPGRPAPNGTGSARTAEAGVAQDIVAATVGDVRSAVLGLSVVTGALVLLGIGAVVAKGLADRRDEARILRSLGADRRTLIVRLLGEAGPWALAAAGAGVLAGQGLALAVGHLGLIRAFGRTVVPVVDPAGTALLWGLAAGLTLAALGALFWRRAGASPTEIGRHRRPGTGRSRAPPAFLEGPSESLVRPVLAWAAAAGLVRAVAGIAFGPWIPALGAGVLASVGVVAFLDLLRRTAPDRALIHAAGAAAALYGPLLWVQDPGLYVLPLVLYALALDRPVAGLGLAAVALPVSPLAGTVAGLAGVAVVRHADVRATFALAGGFLAVAAAGLVVLGDVGPEVVLVPAVALLGRIVVHRLASVPADPPGRHAATAAAVAVPAILVVAALAGPRLGLTGEGGLALAVLAVVHLPLVVWAAVGLHGLRRLDGRATRPLVGGLLAGLAAVVVVLPSGGASPWSAVPYLIWPSAAILALGFAAWSRRGSRRLAAVVLAGALLATTAGAAALALVGPI